MIHRNVEEALHLLRMQVHRQHPAHTGGVQQIRDEFGRNRDPGLVFPVLARVSKKWNNCCDPVRAGAPRRVYHDEQLHQMLISRRTGRLNNENIVAANVFLDPDVSLTIRKRADRGLTERHPNVFANPLGQIAVGGAAENLQFWLKRKHLSKGAKLVAQDRRWQTKIARLQIVQAMLAAAGEKRERVNAYMR